MNEASRRQRRIVRLITRMNIGGPARHVASLARHLSPAYSTVLGAGRAVDVEGELVPPGLEVVRLPLVRDLHPPADLRALAAVRRLLAQQRPDIVHTHTAKAGAVGRLAALTVRPRPLVVHTFHGHVLDGYFARPKQRLFVAAERALARRTDVLVAVSAEVRDQLLDLGIGAPSQWTVIRLGLDLEPYLRVEGRSNVLRRQLDLAPDTPLIGVVGRLAPIKDHATLLRALARLPGVHLAIIGDGELREALERQVDASGLRSQVHFTGWWHDVAAAMADLDVAVLTSRNEGTPVSLIEAGASGRPVVATDVGGVRTVVEHGVNGLLAPAGHDELVARHIRDLLADPQRRSEMGRQGRKTAVAGFGEMRLVEEVRALYDDALAGRRQAG